MRLRIQLVCQPPAIFETSPLLAYFWPRPNGKS